MWASLRRCGISSGIFFVLGQRGDLRQRHARPARLGKTGQRHVGQTVGHRARLRWYGPPPCAAAHHVSKQAPVTQHALPKRFGLVSLRTAPHSRARAPIRVVSLATKLSRPQHADCRARQQRRRSEPPRTAIPITWGCIEPRVFPEKLLQQNISRLERAAAARF
jgi:hypothetical protein